MSVPTSRRALLGAALAGVAATGVARAAAAPNATPNAAPRATPATSGTPEPTALPPIRDAALHAARRLSYGATPALVARLRQVGLSGWLDQQLADGPDAAGTVAALNSTTLPVPTVVLAPAQGAARDSVRDLQVATFARAVWADRQVYELMVEFWSNHLSIAPGVPGVGPQKVADDTNVIRPYALGAFSDLLVASSQSPAMLRYLSNASSRGRTPNENYA